MGKDLDVHAHLPIGPSTCFYLRPPCLWSSKPPRSWHTDQITACKSIYIISLGHFFHTKWVTGATIQKFSSSGGSLLATVFLCCPDWDSVAVRPFSCSFTHILNHPIHAPSSLFYLLQQLVIRDHSCNPKCGPREMCQGRSIKSFCHFSSSIKKEMV